MYREVLTRFPDLDVVVMAAAVADFRPKATAGEKLKKRDGLPEIVLEPTPDILGALGASKGAQVLVGFAAETERFSCTPPGPSRKHRCSARPRWQGSSSIASLPGWAEGRKDRPRLGTPRQGRAREFVPVHFGVGHRRPSGQDV